METVWTCVDELVVTEKGRCYFLANDRDSPDEFDVSQHILARFDIIDVTSVLRRKKIEFEDPEQRESLRAQLGGKDHEQVRKLVEPWFESGAVFVAPKVPRRQMASEVIDDRDIEAAINSYEAENKK